MATLDVEIIEKTRQLLGPSSFIKTGSDIETYLASFRGTKGNAIAAVFPSSTLELYQLINLYHQLNVGYILQGANTALKGQGTPHGSSDHPVVIIKTSLLKHYKILDYPDDEEYKIVLAQPGLPLKELQEVLTPLGYDLPHKTGSHELGNTLGASCATGCGGVRVDNRDGRVSTTQNHNMGLVAMAADGVIYNGIVKPVKISSGEMLLSRIDANDLELDDILLPDSNEIALFIKKLFEPHSYPIRNHRGEIIFSGDGGEGSQAILYQMYLVRRIPTQIKTYAILLKEPELKERLYESVFFSQSAELPDQFPILCESMNASLVQAIVKQGVGYAIAAFFALASARIKSYTNSLLSIRTHCIRLFSSWFVSMESGFGKILSFCLTPKEIRKSQFFEMLIIQIADRKNSVGNIATFAARYQDFVAEHRDQVVCINMNPDSYTEKLVLQIRNVAALTTLTLSIVKERELFAFDDAIMPGTMTNHYCELFKQKLSENISASFVGPYLYGHDLKQINHNDWIFTRKLTEQELNRVYELQLQTVQAAGGFPHAEHGFGDYADTDFDREELVKLVAHRLLNDIYGIANPGGGPERAFHKALLDQTIVQDGIVYAYKAIERELLQGTLLIFSQNHTLDMNALLQEHIQVLQQSQVL